MRALGGAASLVWRFVRPGIASNVVFALVAGAALADEQSAERGRYIFDAAGCTSCHTDSKNGRPLLAGGPALITPFGNFYAPNITPDRDQGIGGWSDSDFLNAMRSGLGPDGEHYYPAFPYVSYSQATDQDLRDLKAYLFTIPPSKQVSRPHDLRFPFSFRPLLWFWKLLNFEPRPWRPDNGRSAEWNRGSYLVNALTHCGECHTPRDALGALDRTRWLAGARLDGGRSLAPNLTPHETGLAAWRKDDIVTALEIGITPDGDVLGGPMGDVVSHSTGKLTKPDLQAIATYLAQLPAVPGEARER